MPPSLLSKVSSHLTSSGPIFAHYTPSSSSSSPPHPFDPLSASEIEKAVSVIRKHPKCCDPENQITFNAVTLWEPRKSEMLAWLADPRHGTRPRRVADVVLGIKNAERGKTRVIVDGLVDLDEERVVEWEEGGEGVQPLITMEELQLVELVIREDEGVIEQCVISGIPREDMHKVYCDPWTIGYDERFGNKHRLQQALMYYRPKLDDNQYAFPLDFTPIFDSDVRKVIHIDIPPVRRPLSKAPPNSYHRAAIEAEGGYRAGLKPLHITQPDGVSFQVSGRIVEWQNWKIHVGFNYREGLVLNNITYNDKGSERGVFYRLSLAEMVVPYGNPEHPHQRKHAFDLGEYGGGYMTNSLALGCDCKGEIHYMDAAFVNLAGKSQIIKNAICIHEEDAGILFKHSDFRDDSVVVTRGRKLVLSHIFTAANYEYCIYWIFHQDGTVQLVIKLTGILHTYAMNPGEDTNGWGTEVYPGVNAHHHQHLFCLRVDPNIDGPLNTIFQVDARVGPGEVGSAENKYGNAFYAHRTRYKTPKESVTDYDASSSRTWEIANTNKVNPYSHKPVSYHLVSRDVPALLPKEGGLVWKRAGFARNAIHVTKYHDDQIHPAGRHVPQTSGDPSQGLPAWIAAHGDESIDNADVVLWHTFGVAHFTAPEDFPVMPVEPITLYLRPRNFFVRNAALDVEPAFGVAPSERVGDGDGDGDGGENGVGTGAENGVGTGKENGVETEKKNGIENGNGIESQSSTWKIPIG